MTNTDTTASTAQTRPDTYALCQHLQQARSLLAVLGTTAANAYSQGEAMDAEQMGDYAAVLAGLVKEAQDIADSISDFCEVRVMVGTEQFHALKEARAAMV
jgi:hypothetical protein